MGYGGTLKLSRYYQIGLYVLLHAGGVGFAIAPLHEAVALIGHGTYGYAIAALSHGLLGCAADAAAHTSRVAEREEGNVLGHKLSLNGHIFAHVGVGAGVVGAAIAPAHELVASIGYSGYRSTVETQLNLLAYLAHNATTLTCAIAEHIHDGIELGKQVFRTCGNFIGAGGLGEAIAPLHKP